MEEGKALQQQSTNSNYILQWIVKGSTLAEEGEALWQQSTNTIYYLWSILIGSTLMEEGKALQQQGTNVIYYLQGGPKGQIPPLSKAEGKQSLSNTL